MQWIVVVVVAVVLAATYLTWMAGRIDRLHARAAASFEALDAALVRRAAAAIKLGEQIGQPELQRLGQAAIDSPETDREIAENELTKTVRELPFAAGSPAMADISAASRRVSLARHIHNDLVRDALALRRRRVVRVMGAGRRHAAPAYFDIEDPQL
jgi:hypothetical protein